MLVFLTQNIKEISEQLSWGDYYSLLRLGESGNGICVGLAYMWAQAVLANDLGAFYNRLNFLCKPYLINGIKPWLQTPGNIKNISSPYGEIRAFLDGLLLYHCPFSSSLSKEVPVQSYLASRYVMPNQLAESNNDGLNKPLERIFHFPICGTPEEIGAYIVKIFNKVRKVLNQNVRFVATLNSTHHSIGLTCSEDNFELLNMTCSYNFASNLISSHIEEVFRGYIKNNKLEISISIYVSPKETLNHKCNLQLQAYEKKLLLNVKNEAKTDGFFWIACRYGHIEVVKLLLHYKANVNQQNNEGSTPLSIACQNGHIEVVKLLLHYKANVNQQNSKYGASPLWFACQNGHIKVVKLLLHYRANANHPDNKYGASPLWIACQNGHIEVVEVLLRNGANVNQQNNDGSTPISIARHYGNFAVVELLFENNALFLSLPCLIV